MWRTPKFPCDKWEAFLVDDRNSQDPDFTSSTGRSKSSEIACVQAAVSGDQNGLRASQGPRRHLCCPCRFSLAASKPRLKRSSSADLAKKIIVKGSWVFSAVKKSHRFVTGAAPARSKTPWATMQAQPKFSCRQDAHSTEVLLVGKHEVWPGQFSLLLSSIFI